MNLLRSTSFLCATIALLTIWVFSSGVDGVFLFDDIRNIEKNETLDSSLFSMAHLNTPRPVTSMSFALNKWLFGPSPTSFHWTNILIHAISGVVLFLLLRSTLSDSLASSDTATAVAYFSALIWAIHPQQTQSVTYIVQRAESMMGMMMFLFLYALRQAKTDVQPVRWLAMAFVVYCIGLGCKEVMITALPVGLLYDRVFIATDWSNLIKRRGWFWGLCLLPIPVGLAKILPALMSSTSNVGFSVAGVSPIEYLQTQPEVILHYLMSLVVPIRLSLDYGWPVEHRVSIILLTTAIVLGGYLFSCRALLMGQKMAFWIVAAGIVLTPTSSFVPLKDIAFDHRMYVPSAFIIVCLIFAVHQTFSSMKWNPRILHATLVVLATSLGAATASRNQLYASSASMWEDVVKKCPNSWRGHFNAACALEKTDPALALQRYEKAIALNPTYGPIWMNLGIYLWNYKSELKEAERCLSRAWELDSTNPLVAANLGAVLLEQQKRDDAAFFLQKSLEMDPNQAVALSNLAFLSLEQGNLGQALGFAEKAVRADSESDDARINLGRVLMAHGQIEEAERSFRKAISLNPNNSVAQYNLGSLLVRKDPARGRQHLERSIAINPKFSQAHNNLAAILEESEPKLALFHYQEAVRHDPKNRQAQENLRLLSQQLGGR